MAQQPRVSIIVPVYNTGDFLEECLDSLVSQTLSNIEILCIDDGSSDHSPAILDAYASRDARVKVVHQANSGVSTSRNKGLDMASGEYVLFVDSDDYIETYSCERLVAVADKDQADIVVFGGLTFPTVGWCDESMSTRRITYKNDSIKALFFECGSYPLMCNKLYRRSLIESGNLRFDSGLSIGEDHAFQFMAFPLASVVSYSPDMLYHYRCEREGSALSTLGADRFKRLREHLAVVSYVLGEWSKNGVSHDHEQELLMWSARFLFNDFQYLPYSGRLEFAHEYRRVLEDNCLFSFLPVLAVEERELVDYMTGSYGDAQRPLLSVIVREIPDEEVLEECLTAALNQRIQSLELYVVESPSSGNCRSILDAFAQKDSRFHLVSSEAEAISQARGDWVYSALGNTFVKWGGLSHLIECADRLDADVVACPDSDFILRTRDVSRWVETRTGGPLSSLGMMGEGGSFCYSPKDAGNLLFSSVSLSSANKLIRRSLIGEAGVFRLDENGVARCLLSSRRVCYVPSAEVEFRAYEAVSEDCVSLLDAGMKSFQELRDFIKTSAPEHLCGTDSACLAFIASTYHCLKGIGGQREYCRAARERLSRTGLIDRHKAGHFFDRADFEFCTSLLEREPDDFVAYDRDVRVEMALADARGLRSALRDRERELRDVYESASYRFGFAATVFPRWLYRKVRGVLKR